MNDRRLDARELRALDLMLGHGLTNGPVDSARAVMAVRAAAASGDRDAGVALVLGKRATHRTWITVTQREWQRHTRRPSRARHHDSIEIRERYVRCA